MAYTHGHLKMFKYKATLGSLHIGNEDKKAVKCAIHHDEEVHSLELKV